MILDDRRQQFSLYWCFKVERIEDRPLCQLMWGTDDSVSGWEVLCYAFGSDDGLAKARRLVSSLARFPWFESLKAVHTGHGEGAGGILSVTRPTGPSLQAAFGQCQHSEQVRLCLELARAIEVLHDHRMTHGFLDGGNVMFDAVRKVPVVCQTVCGFFGHQIDTSAMPPDRRHQSGFTASEKDDVWQFGALFLKRLERRSPFLTKLIFKCTLPDPGRRPPMTWVVSQLESYLRRQNRIDAWLGANGIHRFFRCCGAFLLLFSLWLFLWPQSEPAVPIPRQFMDKGGLTLFREPGARGVLLTLGETMKDLEAVLGKPIVMADHLNRRPMPEGGWLVWDQLLDQMGLGWRFGTKGTIEIFERKADP